MTEAEVINHSPLLPEHLEVIKAAVGEVSSTEWALVSSMSCEAYALERIIEQIRYSRSAGW